jgi:hypothetical protein
VFALEIQNYRGTWETRAFYQLLDSALDFAKRVAETGQKVRVTNERGAVLFSRKEKPCE